MASEHAPSRRASLAEPRRMRGGCPREADTVAAMWDETNGNRLDPDLAAHVAACASCGGIAHLMRGLHEEREYARAEATPPSAGAVWWGAQRRARAEAARAAARPITFVHGIATGCAAAAAVATFSLAFSGMQGWIGSVAGWLTWIGLPAVTVADVLPALPQGALLVLATSLILAPVAIYLALGER